MAVDPRILLGEGKPAETPLARALRACRSQFMAVGIFSGVVNGLQLTVSLYMMQVFDRVLSTRNLNTLLYLTLIAITAVGLLAAERRRCDRGCSPGIRSPGGNGCSTTPAALSPDC